MHKVISILTILFALMLAAPKATHQPEGFAAPVATQAPTPIAIYQAEVMAMARSIAKQVGVNPSVLQSLLLQESNAGAAKNFRVAGPRRQQDRYYGLGQIKVAAARDVLQRAPGLWDHFDFQTRTDEEIIANLILNDKFNITIAAHYLRMLEKEYGFTGRQLLNAYNRGPGGVQQVDDDWHYAISAERRYAAWKQVNR